MIFRVSLSTLALACLLTALLAGCQKGSAPEMTDRPEPSAAGTMGQGLSVDAKAPEASIAEPQEAPTSETSMPESSAATAPSPAETPAPSVGATEESDENEPVKLGRVLSGAFRAARSLVPFVGTDDSERSSDEASSEAPAFVPPAQQP